MLKSYKWKGEELPSLKLRAPPWKMLVGTTILSFLGIQPIFLSCLFLGGTKPAFVGKYWNRLNGWFPQPLQKRFSFSEKRVWVEFNRILEGLKDDPFGLKKCMDLTTYFTRIESTNPGPSARCFSFRPGHLTTQPTSPQIARLPQRSPKVWWTYPQVESLMQNGLPKLAKFRRYPTTLGRQKNTVAGFCWKPKANKSQNTKKKKKANGTHPPLESHGKRPNSSNWAFLFCAPLGPPISPPKLPGGPVDWWCQSFHHLVPGENSPEKKIR